MKTLRLLEHFDRISEAPEAIPELRRFIQGLAVQGRLVLQDPLEESSTELLNRIQRAKVRLTKDGAIKPAQTVDIAEDEIPSRLPASWTWARTETLCEIIVDCPHSTPVFVPSGIACIDTNCFKNGVLISSRIRFVAEDAYHERVRRLVPRAGDIIFAREGSVGASVIVPMDMQCCLGQRVMLFRLMPGIVPGFFSLALSETSSLSRLLAHHKGIGAKHVNVADMRRALIPVPPVAEQHRIVAKLDQLMGLCDRLEKAQQERDVRQTRFVISSTSALTLAATGNQAGTLKALRIHLDQLPRLATRTADISPLREAILALAVRGRLVAQSPADQPAATFLGEHELHLDSDSEPFRLPKGWAWSTLALLGRTIGGGTPSKGNAEFWDGPIPWVSPKDMKVERIGDAKDHISTLALENSAARLIPAGSLLIVVRGMILIHSFPAALTTVPVAINQDMKAIVPFNPALSEFMLLLVKGMKPEVMRLVKRSTHGTCKLLTDELFSLPLPTPPIAEQTRIVARVEQLMALCSELEVALAEGRSQSARLLDSVIHEALTSNVRQDDRRSGIMLAFPEVAGSTEANPSTGDRGPSRLVPVPILGNIAAGVLTLADQRVEGWFRIPEAKIKPADDAWCVLRVRGDSMNLAMVDDAQIEDGDFLLVRRQSSPELGKVVVAEFEGDGVLKRFVKAATGVVLRAESTGHYPDISVGPGFRIQGVVRANLKSGAGFERTDADEV